MRAKKIDNNQNAIVAFFRNIPGMCVHVTSSLGNGFPDLCIGFRGKTYLVEIKDGDRKRLTLPQFNFFHKWTGHAIVIDSLYEATKWIKQL